MNTTELEVNPVARGFLVATCILVVVMGTAGNFLVWYGSVFHSAIKLECCSCTLITNLALTDLVMILSIYIPLGVTAATGAWVFGAEFCAFQSSALLIIICFEMFIMMSLNCYRLWAVKKTKGDRSKIKVWHVYVYLSVVAALCCTSLVGVYIAAGNHLAASFNTKIGLCSFATDSNPAVKLVILGYLVPPLVISFTTSNVLKCILCYTSRRAGTRNTKSQRAISLVCWAMMVSYLPTYISLLWETISPSSLPHAVHTVLPLVMSINLLVNPAIYFYYNKNFRNFVLRQLHIDNICNTALNTNNQDDRTVKATEF